MECHLGPMFSRRYRWPRAWAQTNKWSRSCLTVATDIHLLNASPPDAGITIGGHPKQGILRLREAFGDSVPAVAILDRLLQHSATISIQGRHALVSNYIFGWRNPHFRLKIVCSL